MLLLLHTATRHNGASLPPYDSLNLSFGVGDVHETVAANREKLKKQLGITTLLSARQTHSNRVFVATKALTYDLEIENYDALVTNIPNLALMIQQADCQAVMLYDPHKKIVANIHNGWKGSTHNIIGTTITTIMDRFQIDPTHLRAFISPSLGPCCAEFVHYHKELPSHLHRYQTSMNHFDFWAISRDQLQDAGVQPNHINTAGICTKCSPDYFSYRREGRTGRFASLIALKK